MNGIDAGDIVVGGHTMTAAELALMFQALRPPEAQDLLVVLELLLPHAEPELRFARFATALVIDARLVGELELRAMVLDGLKAIGASTQSTSGVAFRAATGDQQIAALEAAEDTPFFQTLLHIAKADFYNRHIVWETLGYPDLHHEDGYIDDSFDQLEPGGF
jgi:hypothetical protein